MFYRKHTSARAYILLFYTMPAGRRFWCTAHTFLLSLRRMRLVYVLSWPATWPKSRFLYATPAHELNWKWTRSGMKMQSRRSRTRAKSRKLETKLKRYCTFLVPTNMLDMIWVALFSWFVLWICIEVDYSFTTCRRISTTESLLKYILIFVWTEKFIKTSYSN